MSNRTKSFQRCQQTSWSHPSLAGIAVLGLLCLAPFWACTPAPDCNNVIGCKSTQLCKAGRCVPKPAEPAPEPRTEPTPEPKAEPAPEPRPEPRPEPVTEPSQENPVERPGEVGREGDRSPDAGTDGGVVAPEEKPIERAPEPAPEKPALKTLGKSCTQGSECKSGACLEPGTLGKKVCTRTCSADKDCASGSKCVGPRGYQGHCLPSCTLDTDCAGLKNELRYCWNEGYCWKKKSFGAKCKTNRECSTGYSCVDPGYLGAKACTKVCKTDADCKKEKGICELHDPTKPGYCVPSCKTNLDCKNYGKMQVCNTEQHCWLAFLTRGMQCQDNAECAQYPLCADPGGLSFKVCSAPCKTDKDCGGTDYCYKQKPTSPGFCLVGCTKASDCDDAKAFSTPVCKNNRYCWKVEYP